jgi:hypothetical protein
VPKGRLRGPIPVRGPGSDPRQGIVHHVPDGAEHAGVLTRPVHPGDGAGAPRSGTMKRSSRTATARPMSWRSGISRLPWWGQRRARPVHAAGCGPDVWHLMTGLPYCTRLMVGFRKPRSASEAGTSRGVSRRLVRQSPGSSPATDRDPRGAPVSGKRPPARQGGHHHLRDHPRCGPTGAVRFPDGAGVQDGRH